MDYKKIGFKCGIEVHQQVEGKKLFCACPTQVRSDKLDFDIKRKLRAARGEIEKTDIAAQLEQKKDKTFTYQGYDDTTCLVELDEEPPHGVNQEALHNALQFASMLNCRIEDEIRVMRKTVVDGSNTSGFQRTMLIARNGWIEVDGKRIGIESVCLEEDSCMIASRTETNAIYNLSRLGIPLIEIATAPDITDPSHLKNTAAMIGMMLRSISGIKRGLGTIRQDVNISIKGTNRVEIKGAQDLKMLPTLANREIQRHQHHQKLKKELQQRKLDEKELDKAHKEIRDITSHVKKAKTVKFISDAMKQGATAMVLRLPKLAGLIKQEDAKNQRLGYEFARYARVLGFGGVIHSDEDLSKYGLAAIDKEVTRGKQDAFIISIGDKDKIKHLFEIIIERCREYVRGAGIPSEVRKAEQDGSTSYLRPMPGAARMYPETDVAPVTPDVSNLEKVELLSEKSENLTKIGLAKDLADAITRAGKADVFTEFTGRFKNIKPAFLAETMISIPKTIRRKENLEISPTDEDFSHIFAELDGGHIAKDSIYPLLLDFGKTGKLDFSKYELLSDKEVEKEIKKILAENKGIPQNQLMGKVMGKLKGKADPKKVIELLKKR